MFGIDDLAIGAVIGGGIGAAGSLLSGWIGSEGQEDINNANLAQQNYWNQVQLELANTAHQREVADLKAAGLNPILSADSSGASVPTLTAAHLENPSEHTARGVAEASKSAGAAVKSAMMDAPMKRSEINVNSARKENLSAQSENLRAQNENLKAQNELIHAQASATRASAYQTLQDAKYPGPMGKVWRDTHAIGADLSDGLKGVFGVGPYGKNGSNPYPIWGLVNSAEKNAIRANPGQFEPERKRMTENARYKHENNIIKKREERKIGPRHH